MVQVKRWQDFLDSLSTSGGAVLVLLIICVATLPVLIYVVHKAPGSPAAMLVTNTFKRNATYSRKRA
jgi:hypothetical protein